MATYRKRGKSWRVDVYKNGFRFSASFDTKTQAKEWTSQTEAKNTRAKVKSISCNKTLEKESEPFSIKSLLLNN